MAITRKATVVWSGDIKTGKGSISTESGALSEYPYGFAARFESARGSNPEELLGAAHAACFTMALSGELAKAGLTADRLQTTAEVTLDKQGEGWAVTASHLTLEGRVPGADAATFQRLAETAKTNCPLSKVLRADISLSAMLS